MPKMTSTQPDKALDNSVIEFPKIDERQSPYAPLTLYIAEVADEISKWGTRVQARDKQLRQFWPSESTLAGAMYSVAARNSAFQWSLEGPDKLLPPLERMLHSAMSSGGTIGWTNFISAISLDYYGTDNGAFIEVIRATPTSPVLGIAQLDSEKCQRTGDPDYPVIYMDRGGHEHKMAWYQIIPFTELPSPIETMNGVGYCAVSRVLRAAQIMRDMSQYKHEKVSGRFNRAIHIIGGVSKSQIEDIENRGQEDANNAGLIRYMQPLILASLDPEKAVSTATIELASLPDSFDQDQELKWYIANLALAFGVDYQDFAPLPGGNLGTSSQSEILDRKSRGKGPALFMEQLQNAFHWRGVFPRNVIFSFSERDLASQKDEASISKLRAEERAIRIMSGEITVDMARTLAVYAGDLEDEHIAMMGPAPDPIEGDTHGNKLLPRKPKLLEKE